MPFSVTSAVNLPVAIAFTASATVYQGIRTVDNSTSQVAWKVSLSLHSHEHGSYCSPLSPLPRKVEEDASNGTPDPCSHFTKIVDGTGSPYGQDFYVDGSNGPFRLFNCGIEDPVSERAGEFNAVCKFEPRTINCPNFRIQRNWFC
ncbi:hypothetical protein PG985_002380 [Apiospora marii]|uniref:uncharacterized protein n=1 Tax=Apiospora marii TaxID=335849 RepID=UPI00312EC28F